MRTDLPPAMSIAFLHPVLEAMQSLGCDIETLANQLRVSVSETTDAATMLPAGRVYSFLQWSSEQTDDPWLCARIGQSMGRGGWEPINPLFQSSNSVWQFLRRFSAVASEQGGSAIYRLEVEGSVAVWRLTRPKGAPNSARFADALAVGFFVEVLKGAGQDRFEAEDCVVVTSDSSLVPYDVLPSASVIGGSTGAALRFPSEWTEWEMPNPRGNSDLRIVTLPSIKLTDLKGRVIGVIERNIADASYGLDAVAEEIGMKKWRLQRALRTMNTSVANIRKDARHTKASELLCENSLSVSEISAELGYNNPSNFARAFRARSGLSPAEFRRKQLPACEPDK